MQFDPKDLARFHARVAVGEPDQCWLWRGSKIAGGYGKMTWQKKQALATHVALILDGRPRPEAPNHFALHGDSCRSTACVNPRHLRWGSHKENMADRERLGRRIAPRGADHGMATPDTVANRLTKLKAIYLSGRQEDVGRELGMSRAKIGEIRLGKTWAHIPIPTEEQLVATIQRLADQDVRAGVRNIPGINAIEEKKAA